jgi:hypothetical protein
MTRTFGLTHLEYSFDSVLVTGQPVETMREIYIPKEIADCNAPPILSLLVKVIPIESFRLIIRMPIAAQLRKHFFEVSALAAW